MLSMTGFGGGEGQSGPITVTVEMRSVNHRFLDLGLKLPGPLLAQENLIRSFVKENVARGRVTLVAQVELARDEPKQGLDPERLSQGLTMLQGAAAQVEKATGKPVSITLDHLLALPDLFRPEEQDLPADDLTQALQTAMTKAHAELMVMKKAEGQMLVQDMLQRLATLRSLLAEVEEQVPQAAQEIHARLQERVKKLTNDAVDPQRLAQEVALLADRANINEECERLGIHIDHFDQALQTGGQVAKRLNFLLQEMHREVNTMGSKTAIMAITQAVISMKDEVESMREQVQNLE